MKSLLTITEMLGRLFADMKSRLLLFPIVILSILPSSQGFAAPFNFNRDIRPILADRCFHCHGPAKNNREANLRLDQPDGEEGARSIVLARSHRTTEMSRPASCGIASPRTMKMNGCRLLTPTKSR